MRLTKEDKEVLIYSVLMLVTLILFALIFQINQRGSSIMESPRLLPYIVTGCMFLLSMTGIIQSLRNNGRPTLGKIKGSLLAAAADKTVRPNPRWQSRSWRSTSCWAFRILGFM